MYSAFFAKVMRNFLLLKNLKFQPLYLLNCTDLDTCSMEGTIRLVNGSNATEGTVEVCNGTRYGTVCDDHWDELDARVVCRQLGYSGEAVALKRAFFGSSPSRPIYLDNVRCNGSEPSLFNCTANEVGINNCDHSEDAGVRCNGTYNLHINQHPCMLSFLIFL